MNPDKLPETLSPEEQKQAAEQRFVAPETKEFETQPANQPIVDPIPAAEQADSTGTIRQRINSSKFRGFFSVFQLFVGAVLLALFINHFIFQSYEVFGLSMTPTLNEGDRLIISKIEKSWKSLTGGDYSPERGEIVVFHNPINTEVQLVKRVIGLPGDRVEVDDGNIIIYNDEFPNGYKPDIGFELELGVTAGNVDITVPEGHVFVSGDNRGPGGSLDSRNDLGTIPIDQIVGELMMRVLPISDASFF